MLEILRDVRAKVSSIQVQLHRRENRQESFREGVKHLAARIDPGAVASAPNTPATPRIEETHQSADGQPSGPARSRAFAVSQLRWQGDPKGGIGLQECYGELP